MSNCAAQVVLGKLLKIFATVDKDGSNAIEPPELVEVLQGFYKGLTEEKLLEQATATIESYDTNGDGKLQFGEFVDMVHCGDFWVRFGFGPEWFNADPELKEQTVALASDVYNRTSEPNCEGPLAHQVAQWIARLRRPDHLRKCFNKYDKEEPFTGER